MAWHGMAYRVAWHRIVKHGIYASMAWHSIMFSELDCFVRRSMAWYSMALYIMVSQ
jgi:hypothetical protein